MFTATSTLVRTTLPEPVACITCSGETCPLAFTAEGLFCTCCLFAFHDEDGNEWTEDDAEQAWSERDE